MLKLQEYAMLPFISSQKQNYLAKLHFRGTEKSKYWYSYQLLMKISFLDKMNIEKNINKNWRKSQYKIVLKIELKINIDIYINK